MHRIGIGNDIHRLTAGRPLIIGGVRIDSEFGGDGHSDADVLLHAITDAILGAAALGDIGRHFPDSDERWRDADSVVFLREAARLCRELGYSIVNVDSTVNLERPKIRPYIEEMRRIISRELGIGIDCISIKAKTGEGMDAVGEGRAIRADAAVLLEKP